MFVDCLFCPTSVTVGSTGSCTIANNSTGGVAEITNCYYTQSLGTVQGKQAHSITAGEFVTMENAGNSTEYDISGIVSYGVGISYSDKLYAGVDDEVSLNLNYEWTDGAASGFQASAGTLVGGANPYTLTMPNADVLVNANLDAIPWEGEGTENDPYVISLLESRATSPSATSTAPDSSVSMSMISAFITSTHPVRSGRRLRSQGQRPSSLGLTQKPTMLIRWWASVPTETILPPSQSCKPRRKSPRWPLSA